VALSLSDGQPLRYNHALLLYVKLQTVAGKHLSINRVQSYLGTIIDFLSFLHLYFSFHNFMQTVGPSVLIND